MPENPGSAPAHMGDVYDNFAEAFAKSDALPTWRFVGRPAMEKLLKPHFGPDTTFLDFGSASGRVEKGLLIPNGVRPENITGIEISPEQVAIAQQAIPGARFMVGDITKPMVPDGSVDVVFSHMVFEHLDDDQLLAASKNAYAALKPGGTFAFVVTHPDKMTDLDGTVLTTYGHFKTSAPWGGELDNWRRSIDATRAILEKAGFVIDSLEELPFPPMTETVPEADKAAYADAYEKYRRYPAIRLAISARKA